MTFPKSLGWQEVKWGFQPGLPKAVPDSHAIQCPESSVPEGEVSALVPRGLAADSHELRPNRIGVGTAAPSPRPAGPGFLSITSWFRRSEASGYRVGHIYNSKMHSRDRIIVLQCKLPRGYRGRCRTGLRELTGPRACCSVGRHRLLRVVPCFSFFVGIWLLSRALRSLSFPPSLTYFLYHLQSLNAYVPREDALDLGSRCHLGFRVNLAARNHRGLHQQPHG